MKLLKFLSWLCLIITFTSFPYIGNYLFGPLYVLVSTGLICLLCFCTIGIYLKQPFIKADNTIWLYVWTFYLFSVFAYAMLMFLKEGTFYDLRRFIGLLFKVLFGICAIFVIIKNKDFVKLFLKVNYIIACLSILLFFLIIFNVNVPNITFEKIDGRSHYFFFIGASNAVYNWNGIKALRIAGFADEPGAFALMLNYFLCINELTERNKRYRIVFTLAGILSFSLAFYLTLLFFVIYWSVIGVLRIKTILLLASIIGILIFIINSIFPIEALSKIFNMFFNRFTVNPQTGRIEGDNRSQAFDLQLSGFKQNLWLGIGDNPALKEEYKLGYPSLIAYLTNYGIYGIIFFFQPLYVLALKYIFRKELILILALLISYLQRPGIEDMFTILALSIIFIKSTPAEVVSKNEYQIA